MGCRCVLIHKEDRGRDIHSLWAIKMQGLMGFTGSFFGYTANVCMSMYVWIFDLHAK